MYWLKKKIISNDKKNCYLLQNHSYDETSCLLQYYWTLNCPQKSPSCNVFIVKPLTLIIPPPSPIFSLNSFEVKSNEQYNYSTLQWANKLEGRRRAVKTSSALHTFFALRLTVQSSKHVLHFLQGEKQRISWQV